MTDAVDAEAVVEWNGTRYTLEGVSVHFEPEGEAMSYAGFEGYIVGAEMVDEGEEVTRSYD